MDRDWQPGPYPKTEAERLAAAKKYNLLPEEYQAYDPEKWDFAYGDYPQLPNICFRDKDPYYPFDYSANRLNYGEPIHVCQEMYGPSGVYMNIDFDVPAYEMILAYTIVIVSIVYVNYFFRNKYEKITRFKLMHRIHPHETYYHYPNSNLSVYE